MYAIIESDGRQYQVREGDMVRMERRQEEIGSTLSFARVLLIGAEGEVRLGDPCLPGGAVTAEIVSHGRGPKIRIVKLRRRKHSRKQAGHRQGFTTVRITGITLPKDQKTQEEQGDGA